MPPASSIKLRPSNFGSGVDASHYQAAHLGFTVEVDSLAAEAWDRIATEFDDLTYDQIACFADGQWGPHRTSHLLLRKNGVPVAGAQLAILTLPGVSRGLAYSRFGPIWRRCDNSCDLSVYRAAVAALFEEYCTRRGHYLTLIPRPNPDHYALECQVLCELGFRIRRPFMDSNRYLVDVTLDEDAQMQSLEQKWRYNLKKAQQNRIDIRLCESGEDIDKFENMHAAMVARKRFHDGDPLHLLPDLSMRLPDRLRPRIALGFHDGRPIVGAVVALLGDTGFYVFGASDDTALPLKAGYALQWWIARWLSQQGVHWYDLGGEALDRGLRQFKKGFVGKRGRVVAMTGEYDRWTGIGGRMVADAIYWIRDVKRAIRSVRYGR